MSLKPFEWKDEPALIEHLFPVQKIFAENFIRKFHQHAGIKRLSFFVVAVVTAMYVIRKSSKLNTLSYFVVGRPRPEYGLPMAVYKKVQQTKRDFHASLWADRGQNKVCPWQLYETPW